MHRFGFFLLCAIISLRFGNNANSQTYFEEKFDGSGVSSLLYIPSDYSISAGKITPAGPRTDYIRTIESAYNIVDFKMKLTIHLDNQASATGIAWVGIGSGLADANWFNQPKYSCYAALQPATQGGGGFTIDSVPLPSDGPQVWQSRWVAAQSLGDTIRLEVIKNGNLLTFSLDPNFTGNFNAVFSDTIEISTYASYLDTSNSKLFFGSGAGTGFSDFSVSPVPEPSALSLLTVGLGGLALLRQGRKKD